MLRAYWNGAVGTPPPTLANCCANVPSLTTIPRMPPYGFFRAVMRPQRNADEVSNVWVDSKRGNKCSAVIPDGHGAAPRRADRTFLAITTWMRWLQYASGHNFRGLSGFVNSVRQTMHSAVPRTWIFYRCSRLKQSSGRCCFCLDQIVIFASSLPCLVHTHRCLMCHFQFQLNFALHLYFIIHWKQQPCNSRHGSNGWIEPFPTGNEPNDPIEMNSTQIVRDVNFWFCWVRCCSPFKVGFGR